MPEMQVALAADKSAATPGDLVGFTGSVRYPRALVRIRGELHTRNGGQPQASVSDFFDYVRYYDKVRARWVPLAGVQAGSPVASPPITSGLSYSAEPVAASGVSYATDGARIKDTVIDGGAEAVWRYEAVFEITPAVATVRPPASGPVFLK